MFNFQYYLRSIRQSWILYTAAGIIFKFCSSKMSSRTYVSSVELQERAQQNPPQLPPSYAQPVPSLSSQNGASHDARGVQQQLEPVDSGVAAWRLLGAAFVFEALFWGKAFHITLVMKRFV